MYILGEFAWFRVSCVIFAVVLGAALGSFACCQAWRIRLKEEKKKDLGKRSVCLSCGKKLNWYENIPIVSYALQRGRCRKCGGKIGVAELWSEVAGAVGFGALGWWAAEKYLALVEACGFGLSYLCGQDSGVLLFWIKLIIVVIFATIMLILAIYDARWRELPTKLLWTAVGLGAIYAVLNILWAEQEILQTLGAVGVLGGIYYILYFASRERLVGGGDWILGLSVALVLGDWWLSIWVLFIANFVGAMVMLPQKKKKIGFAPFLVGAFVVVFAFTDFFAKFL